MGGDIRNVGTESKRLQGLDQHVKAAEGGNNLVEAKTAYEALQHELAQINNLHDPAYARALKAAVGKIDPNPDFQLTHDGKLEIQPLHMAQDTSTVADQTQTHYERRYPSDAIGDSIQMEQALLRGGNNSLYDKVARFEGNAKGVPFLQKPQDPNSPDTELRLDDFQRYADHLKSKRPLTGQDKVDAYELDTLMKHWGQIAGNIGDGFDGEWFISKRSMGMNQARGTAHALLDGGSNNLFDKIVRSQSRYEDPRTAQLHAWDISEYVKAHGNELTDEQRTYLSRTADSMSPTERNDNQSRDWIAGLIGYDDGLGGDTYLTRQSILNGMRAYDLDSFRSPLR
jgi:hypothetical protein